MHSLDLNLLAALDALLEHGSVAGAAEELGLSPSAMSRTLSRIRARTEDPLLVRAGRGLVPTPRAVAMRERVRAALDEARALLGPGGANDLGSAQRVVTLRADDSVTALVGPALLERAAREVPGLSVVFCSEGSEDVAALREGRVDLDIGVQGALGPEVRTRGLLEDERVVLVRAGSPEARRRMTLRRYAEAQHVDVSRRGLLRGPIDEALEARGLERHVRMVVPTQLAAAMLVTQSDAISLVSARFAEVIRSVLGVHALRPPAPLARVSIALAWHPRHDGDAVHAWLRKTLTEIAASIRSRTRSRRRGG